MSEILSPSTAWENIDAIVQVDLSRYHGLFKRAESENSQ